MKIYSNCIRCGRKLKNEESKELGFGKICWEKWQSETMSNKLFVVRKDKKDESTRVRDI